MIGPLVGRIVVGIVALLGTVRYGGGLYVWRVTEKLERPTYDVVKKLPGGVEVRKYDPYLIAETTVVSSDKDFRDTTGNGFRTCASYIFGKNKKPASSTGRGIVGFFTSTKEEVEGEKMAMTAPVRATSGGGKKTRVSFVIGSKYTLSSAPRPVDKNVQLRKVPQHYLAVRQFSGPPPTDQRVQKERQSIDSALAEAGIRPNDDETLVYGYHDPFITPNFLRRNEVAVTVDSSTLLA